MVDLTLKPSLAKYEFRPDREELPPGPERLANDKEELLLQMVEEEAALAQQKLKTGEVARCVATLQRAYRLAEEHERSVGQGNCPAARLACACVRLQVCAVLSSIGRHATALQEARLSMLEADGIWQSLLTAAGANQNDVTFGDGAGRCAKPLRKLFRSAPSWLEKLALTTIQSRHCVALELEFQVSEVSQTTSADPADSEGGATDVKEEEPPSAPAPSATAPVFVHVGREFQGHTDHDAVKSKGKRRVLYGEAFSVAFTARWNCLGYFGHCVEMRTLHGNEISVYQDRNSCDLVFRVARDLKYRTCIAKGAIELKKVHRYLCTVTVEGHMVIQRDGVVIGERPDGHAPYRVFREFVHVGNGLDKDKPHIGLVADVVAWNEAVRWQDATGALVGSGPHAERLLQPSGIKDPPLAPEDEIERLFCEELLLARRLLPDGHSMIATIEHAQRGALERRQRCANMRAVADVSSSASGPMDEPDDAELTVDDLPSSTSVPRHRLAVSAPSGGRPPTALLHLGLRNRLPQRSVEAPCEGSELAAVLMSCTNTSLPSGDVGDGSALAAAMAASLKRSTSAPVQARPSTAEKTASKKPEEKQRKLNAFEDFKQTLSNPDFMSPVQRKLRTEPGVFKLIEEMRGQSRVFTNLTLKEMESDTLYENRIFHSNAGVRQRQRTMARYPHSSDRTRDSSPEVAKEREKEREKDSKLLSSLGIKSSSSEPNLKTLARCLHASHVRAGYGARLERQRSTIPSAPKKNECKEERQERQEQARRSSLAQTISQAFTTSKSKGPRAHFERDVEVRELGPRSTWTSPHAVSRPSSAPGR